MDTYENNLPEEEIAPENVQRPSFKKDSPFADSPYVMFTDEQTEPVPAPVKKKSGKFWKRALCAVLVIVLVAGSCAATAMVVNDYWEERTEHMTDKFEKALEDIRDKIGNAAPVIPGGTVSSAEGVLTPSQVYAMNVASVVLIYNKVTANMYGQTSTATSTGTGFILTEDGYVVTNYHVVEGGGSLTVITNNEEEHAATLVGYDSANDVALLKVEATGLQAVTLGSSSALIVGDQVAAIGNPLGELTSTLTVGYVSAMERDVNTDGFAINMIQTDAAINSGNSGGPLFNMRGEVIGITTAKYSGTSSSGATIEGIGFAIPIDDVSSLLSDLATYGYVTGAYLGVSVSDTNAEAAAYFGAPVGAYVEEVVDGFAAQKAGLKVKDIIVKLGDYEVENVNDLTRALRNFSAGDTTTLTVYRSGQEVSLSITLDEKPVQTEPQTETTLPEELPSSGSFDENFGFLFPFFGN